MTRTPLIITMSRHVGVWFYIISGLTALFAVGWMARRRLVRLGTRLLALGVLVNAIWEFLLFTVWTRRYETVVPTVVQAVYHSLTEFAPLLVLVILLLERSGYLDLSPWAEPQTTRVHRAIQRGAMLLFGGLVVASLGSVLVDPGAMTTPITIYREITWWYFAAEAVLAGVVLASAVQRRDEVAILLFAIMGTFNVVFEVMGLLSGFRGYQALPWIASVGIGFAESGTAAALVWMAAMQITNADGQVGTDHRTNDPQTHRGEHS